MACPLSSLSLPVIVLLGALAFGHVKAHYAALAGLVTALLTAIFGISYAGAHWPALPRSMAWLTDCFPSAGSC